VPIPYPNIDRSSDHGAKSVKVEGDMASTPGAAFTPSEGDEPGTAGSGLPPTPGGTNPLHVAGAVLVVVIVVIVTVYLLMGDGNGNGDDGPGHDMVIDPDQTTVESMWEPTPGFHISVVIRNEGDDTTSLDDHDLLVVVLQGSEEVSQATMVLSGDLAVGHGRGVVMDVGVGLTSGETYEVKVLLRWDRTIVDAYSAQVTIAQV
jgi:hypothetical protein